MKLVCGNFTQVADQVQSILPQEIVDTHHMFKKSLHKFIDEKISMTMEQKDDMAGFYVSMLGKILWHYKANEGRIV